MEEVKQHWGRYVKGGIGGAVLVIILGFAVGPLTTNGNAAQQVATAIQDRDATYCVANALKLVAAGEQAAPTSGTERTNLAKASFASLLPEAKFENAAFRTCSSAFPRDFQ